MFIASALGGWSDIVNSLELSEDVDEGYKVTTHNGSSMRIGFFVFYDRYLTIELKSKGLKITPFVLSSAFHKPIFIPWKAIKENYYFNDSYFYNTLEVRVAGRDIKLYHGVASSVNNYLISRG